MQNELEQMRTIQAEILESVQNRVLTIEEWVRLIATDLTILREAMHSMTVQIEHVAHVRRWAMMVKLGTSLIPPGQFACVGNRRRRHRAISIIRRRIICGPRIKYSDRWGAGNLGYRTRGSHSKCDTRTGRYQ